MAEFKVSLVAAASAAAWSMLPLLEQNIDDIARFF